MERKCNVINKVDKKIKTLPSEPFSKFHENVHQQNNPLNTLNDFYNHFVVTPIDEVNGNVVFIWQRFYAL